MAAVEEELEIEDGVVTDIWYDPATDTYMLCITYDGTESIQSLSADDWCGACAEAERIVAQFRLSVA